MGLVPSMSQVEVCPVAALYREGLLCCRCSDPSLITVQSGCVRRRAEAILEVPATTGDKVCPVAALYQRRPAAFAVAVQIRSLIISQLGSVSKRAEPR